jgi:hypothetical protein
MDRLCFQLSAPRRSGSNVTHDLFNTTEEIDRLLDASKTDTSGDFTSRLSALVKSIVLDLKAIGSRSGPLPSAEELTNIIFRIDLRTARTLVEKAGHPRAVIFSV